MLPEMETTEAWCQMGQRHHHSIINQISLSLGAILCA